MAVELSGVEPRAWPLNAEMIAGGGPAVIGSGGSEAGADGIHFDRAKGGGPMGVVDDAG